MSTGSLGSESVDALCPNVKDVDELLLSRDLTAAGIESGELRSRTESGSLLHLRRGAYATPLDRTVRQEHLLLVRSAITFAETESVVSFGSAALVHGLPVPDAVLQTVHVTKIRNSGGKRRPGVHVHVAPLNSAEIVTVDGLPVTSLDRTFVDLARGVGLYDAVAAGDLALRRGMDPAAVVEQLEMSKRRRGIRNARLAARLIDARSESYAESKSRVIMFEQRLPRPELQVEIIDTDGFEARVDFLWEDLAVIGEFDGEQKYGRLLRDGEAPSDAVFREKIREDRLRELGYIVVRWVWDDLRHPERLAARIRRALEVAAASRRRPTARPR